MVLASGVVIIGDGGSAAGRTPAGGDGRATATAVDIRALQHVTWQGVPAGLGKAVRSGRTGLAFDGLAQDDTMPTRPAEVSATVGSADVVEVVNHGLAVYTKGGARRCAVTLAGLFGVAGEPSNPRVQYDARYRRFSVLATAKAVPGAAAAAHLATTQGPDPCAGWWTYRLTFTGPMFPRGARLDRPNLGQDPVALLMSSDNYHSGEYIGSAAFAVAKSAVYAGAPLTYPAFAVAFATVPVTSDQVDGAFTDDSYYLAALPGFGYLLYRMTSSAGPGTMLMPEANVAAPFEAPTRPVRQCAGGPLDPLDGRISAPPIRAGDYVWFTHGFNAGGRPGVRYGALSLASTLPYLATAAHSATSDDFNASIAVADAGSGYDHIWLNWSSTDVTAQPCADVSAVAAVIAPGAGLPDLAGGLVFARGRGSGTDAPFGAYSSAAVDPVARGSCGTGRSAVLAQQYFGDDGRWRTRLARIDSC
jgi:hypothetical protein